MPIVTWKLHLLGLVKVQRNSILWILSLVYIPVICVLMMLGSFWILTCAMLILIAYTDILVFLSSMSLSVRKPISKSALSLVHIAVNSSSPSSSEKRHSKDPSTTSTAVKVSRKTPAFIFLAFWSFVQFIGFVYSRCIVQKYMTDDNYISADESYLDHRICDQGRLHPLNSM